MTDGGLIKKCWLQSNGTPLFFREQLSSFFSWFVCPVSLLANLKKKILKQVEDESARRMEHFLPALQIDLY